MRKYMDANLFILLFTLCLAGFAFFNAKNDEKIKNDIRDNTNELTKASKSIIKDLTAAGQNIEKSQKDAEVTYEKVKDIYDRTLETFDATQKNNKITVENLKEIIATKEATISAQHEIINQMTGGSSYIYFKISNKELSLHVEGNYSIPEISYEIWFINDYLKLSSQESSNFLRTRSASSNITQIGGYKADKFYQNTIYPTFSIPDNVVDSILQNSGSGFDINFRSAYKQWTQSIRLIRNPYESKTEITSVIYEFSGVRANNNIPIRIEVSDGYDKLIEPYKKVGVYPIVLFPHVKTIDCDIKHLKKNLNFIDDAELK